MGFKLSYLPTLAFCWNISQYIPWRSTLMSRRCTMKLATSTKTAVVIDVVKHGYFKVLGKGTLPNIPDCII